jgi:hypothetical protein
MTIVRVQCWPPGKRTQLYRVFDQYHARECILYEVPEHIQEALASREPPYHNWGYFDDATYDYDAKLWDLTNATYLRRDREWR